MRSEFEKNVIHKQIIDRVRFSEKANQYLPIDASSGVDRGCADVVNVGWISYQYQQSKVDELQKKNAWLSDVAKRENKRANKLQEEEVSTTTLLGKTIQEKNELQKRVDAAKYYMKNIFSGDAEVDQCHLGDLLDILGGKIVGEIEQALKGGEG